MIERVHRKPGAKMFEGQLAPDLPMMSIDNIDWYKEMKLRSKEGFSFRGDRFTGDQWWFYNLCPMTVAILDKFGNPTKDFDMGFPYWSQEDDYLFKQIEEADQDDKGVMIMTGRGFGKTQIVLSIGGKGFYFTNKFEGIISASGDLHADATWKKFSMLVAGVNKAHPSIAVDLLKENTTEIISGNEINDNGKWTTTIDGFMQKIVYGNLPGKTKGRRIHYQHWEEIGDWAGAATLKECIAASRGTLWVGKTKKGRDFYTGTGGTVLSDQAKEICYNPDAYGLYKVYNWTEKGTSIVIPAFKKYGGYWEKTGISDEVGAKAELDKLKADAKTDPDPTIYNKLVQEYPDNIKEMFAKRGGNRFDMDKIASNLTTLEMFPEKRQGEWGDLIWRKKDGQIIGVDWQQSNTGKIWILEKPFIKTDLGVAWPRLYVGGYDGIDVGTEDTSSGKGSSGAISIKKRLLPGSGLSNAYVCHYFDRPKNIDEFFENCWKIMYYFNAITNIEDTKRGIVGFLKQKKALHYLMPRPRLTLNPNSDPDKDSNLIGTTPTTKNFEYGENFLINHIKDYGPGVCIPVLEDLRDFTMDNRGEHDITVSMFMAEIADDEFMDKILVSKPAVVIKEDFGYYTDRNGKKRWGKKPNGKNELFAFKDETMQANYLKNGKMISSREE